MARLTAFARTHRRWLVRFSGSALFLTLLFWLLPADTLLSAMAAISPALMAGVLALFLVAHVVAAMKWWLLLGREIPAALALRAHFAGLAANLCLPGALGGDAVRAGIAHRSMQDGARVVAVAAVDRLIDMFSLVSLSVIGLLFARSGGASVGLALNAVLFLVAIAAGLALLPKILPLLFRALPRLPGRRFADNLVAAFAQLGRNPGLLALAFAISLMVQGALILLSWWLALGVAVQVSLPQWAFAWPLAKVLAVLPVSLNGLGVREAALAAILSPFGAVAALVVAAGLVWQAVLFIAGGIGAIVFAISRRPGKAPEAIGKGVSE